ncbi:amidohydrolase family protein [Cellulomonas sp. ATA003]|uniref:amidohydrolase family protein n=1 Tax=Cellulomonas sp. ATA003 TaxID=3073064 RepID=UPI0028732586|nr:amidohydrolase family protein [Cellulomonas sp. ATA003]WNB86181.1 amidohydrolase family protein [Cellulomonas sp. ATA003]
MDAHHHLWVRARHPQTWMDPTSMAAIDDDFTEADYADLARSAGVTASVVVQSVHAPSETPELLAVAGTSDVVRGVVGWVDLESPDVAERLAALRAAPGGDRLVGIRHLVQSEPDPDFLARPSVRRGVAAVGDAGLVYDLLVSDGQLGAAADLVGALPGTTFVLDHLAKPDLVHGDLTRWAEDLHRLAAHPNVAAKVSGLVTEADWSRWTVADLRPAVDRAFDAFGPDRVMFGSDWPVLNLAGDYGRWLDAAAALLPAAWGTDERAAFWGGNARRTYRLGGLSDRP